MYNYVSEVDSVKCEARGYAGMRTDMCKYCMCMYIKQGCGDGRRLMTL